MINQTGRPAGQNPKHHLGDDTEEIGMAHGPQHDQVFVLIEIAFLLGTLQDLQDKIMDR